jgi:hypothetical protein
MISEGLSFINNQQCNFAVVWLDREYSELLFPIAGSPPLIHHVDKQTYMSSLRGFIYGDYIIVYLETCFWWDILK